MKTNTVINIEKKMAGLDPQGMRYKVLEAAKDFKGSWFELGRYLYAVYKDKLYKEWGFMAFDSYCLKEIGIRRQTAVKLLKSYYFIEKDEPDLVNAVPNYETVNILRLAKNNPVLNENDYRELKDDIFEQHKDFPEVGRQFRSMIRQAREQSDPATEHRMSFQRKLRRIISSLKSIKFEVEIKAVLPDRIFKQIDELIAALEKKLEEK